MLNGTAPELPEAPKRSAAIVKELPEAPPRLVAIARGLLEGFADEEATNGRLPEAPRWSAAPLRSFRKLLWGRTHCWEASGSYLEVERTVKKLPEAMPRLTRERLPLTYKS